MIFFVDWTDRIRRRTTRSFAPTYSVPVLPVGLVRPGVLGGRLDVLARGLPSASSTDDIRSQPTSGLTSSGGVALAEPGSARSRRLGWKRLAESAEAPP